MPAPIPIAFCITELEVGGAERAMVDLVTRLNRGRFTPTVLVLAERPEPRQSGLLERLRAADVEVRFLGARSILSGPRVLYRMHGLLGAMRPRILQTFLFHANVIGAAAGRWAGIAPIIAGVRVAERRPNLHHFLTRRTSRWVARHVCVSRSVADFCCQVVGLPREQLHVIPSGVAVDQFPAQPALDFNQLGLAPGRRAIVYVGRLTAQKRVDWLLQRMPTILEKLPQHDLIVAGRGEAQSNLQRLAEQLGLSARVHFAGWRPDVPAILASSDLLLLTSRWEGLPRVVLEAMASRKPVVAIEAEGVSEALGSEAGQVVAPNNASGFERAVVRIVCDPDLAERIGAANRQRVEQQFDVRHTVTAYESLYEELIAVGERG